MFKKENETISRLAKGCRKEKGEFNMYEVIDINGKVVREFPSKNQAEKFKKECNAHGKYGLKVIKKEVRK